MLCHGLSGDTQAWVNQLSAFSQRYQVVTWDARGHGRSDSPADPNAYGLTRFAEDLKVLLGHLGLEQVYLLGHSMGGGVAVRFATTYPERVKALVVTDSFTGSGLPTTAGVRAMREKSIDLALTQGMNAVADHALQENANVMGRIRGDSVEERAMRMRYTKIDPNGYAGSVRTILDNGFPDEWWGQHHDTHPRDGGRPGQRLHCWQRTHPRQGQLARSTSSSPKQVIWPTWTSPKPSPTTCWASCHGSRRRWRRSFTF